MRNISIPTNTQKDVLSLKQKFWPGKKVLFHSRDIRKCEKEFQILLDSSIKASFYNEINAVMQQASYTIISSAINKGEHIRQYGRLVDNVYEIALSFILERAVFFLDDNKSTQRNELKVIIEKRGRKEDRELFEHFQKTLSRGTGYVDAARLKAYNISCTFLDKKDDNVGLQLADLVAYPIARYIIDPERANPAFDLLEGKFYQKAGKRYGLKVFPKK